MSDKDHQDTQAKKEKTTDDGNGTPENYSLSLDDSMPIEDLPESAQNAPQAKDAARDEHLAWLDGTESGSSTTEMPTLHHPGKPAHATIEEPDTPVANRPPAYLQGLDDSQPLDNFDDAMAWLEKLAASKGEPLEELPTQIIPKDVPIEFLNSMDEENLPDIDTNMGVIDDPISWLEQLAADQDTPLEELPSVADRLLASEIISQIADSQGTAVSQIDPPEVAVPLEDALLYLEQIAQDEGVQLQTVALDPAIDTRDLDALLLQVDQLAAGDISALPLAVMTTAVAAKQSPPMQTEVDWNDLSATMPEDPDEALAWMESLAAAAGVEVDSESENVAVGQIIAGSDLADLDTLPPTTVGARNEEEYLDGMPEDPDEMMAYLERVSADKEQEPASATKEIEPAESSQPQQTTVELSDPKVESALAAASQALADGDIAKALAGYKALLAQGDDLDAVVAELETAVAKNPEIGRLHYLLGDAYMKNGQHHEALRAYQQGSLDNL